MFLNVATFTVTNRFISFTKKKIDVLKHFYLLLNNVPTAKLFREF
jgi:hypothetical protein